MKSKLLIILLAVILLAACSTPKEEYTGRRAETEDIEVKTSGKKDDNKVNTSGDQTQDNGKNNQNDKNTDTKNVDTNTKSENITVQAAISSKVDNNTYKITNVYQGSIDKMLENMTLNLSSFQGSKNFESGDVIEITGSASNGVLYPNSIHFISKASGYNEDDLKNTNEDPAPKVGDRVVINGTVLQANSGEILLESISGDIVDDMAKVFTNKDFSGQVKAGGSARVVGTIQGWENESVLINASEVYPQ